MVFLYMICFMTFVMLCFCTNVFDRIADKEMHRDENKTGE